MDKSPLLPIRHEADFFVCDVFDAPYKGDQASMEHPIFTLSKKKDMSTRRYENGDTWCEVKPSPEGLATVFDRDVLIYCISQCVNRLNKGERIARSLRFTAHDLLIATNRQTSGRGYQLLKDAFSRLQGTQITTNIVTGGKEQWDVFSLIDRARIVRETRDGRMQEVEITLSDWVFNAIEGKEILTLDRRYFQLARPLERRLYELARKHVGEQPQWRIGLEKLQRKTGSQSTLREFKRLLKSVIEDDAQHDHMPTYSIQIEEDDMIVFKRKRDAQTPFMIAGAFHQISDETREEARKVARGWDLNGLEQDWRGWIADKHIKVKNPDAHFLAFCRKRGPYK